MCLRCIERPPVCVDTQSTGCTTHTGFFKTLIMHTTDRRAFTHRSTCHSLAFPCLVALAALIVGCSSTEPAPTTLTGVWGGRMAYVTPSDSFAFYLEQSGAEVRGWGLFYSGAGPGSYTHFAGSGAVAGGELTLTLTDVSQNSGIFAATYTLSGPVGSNPMNAVFAGGGKSYPIRLRPARPAASDVGGTWALASTTGAAAPAGLLDTIVVNGDGRAYRHREGDDVFAQQAIWSRHGNYLVLDSSGGGLLKDSLLISATALQRTAVTGSGTRTERYSRVSTSAELP
jgi:hypothetical protein